MYADIKGMVEALEARRVKQERLAKAFHEIEHCGNGDEMCGSCLAVAAVVLDALQDSAPVKSDPEIHFVQGYQC